MYELQTRSALSLLGGAALPEQLVDRAAELGYRGIALTDEMDMGGVVRFSERAREVGIDAILGAQILLESGRGRGRGGQLELDQVVLPDESRLTLLAEDAEGYRNICRLITRARMECPRDRPRVTPSWLSAYLDGVVVLDGGLDGPVSSALRAGDREGAERVARWLRRVVPAERLYLEVYAHDTHEERRLSKQVDDLGEALGIPRVVAGDVRYALPQQKPLYDLLTCVKHRQRLAEAGTRLLPSSEWALQPLDTLRRRWRERPELLTAAEALGERLRFRFENLNPELPVFPIPPRFPNDDAFLEHLTWEGARLRYPELSDRHRHQIRHELGVIRERRMAGYFLITWDIARFCRSRGILAQGRGSAANSAVCYCLHITAVDPIGMELLFERFLSEGRKEYPDIDIDISHEWREEAIQYVYTRYGRDRAALACEQIRYRGRSAIRDVAWALSFEQDQIDRLAAQAGHARYGWEAEAAADWQEQLNQASSRIAGIHPEDPRLPLLLRLVSAIQGIPRHRSIHPGGMILTAEPLCGIVPLEPASMPDRTVLQWEKDDLPYSGLAKFDLLGLGSLSLLQKALTHMSEEQGRTLGLADLPQEDPAVYQAFCRADTVGVFQIESRAQMSTLPRLKPRCFYDLVVEIALIRPGPIQGNMVHPYLRRRDGEEPVEYLHPDLEPILRRTLGVPIFQEQVMRIAIELADFTPSQADELRRAMGFRRYSPRMETLRAQLHEGMGRRAITPEVQDQIIEFLTAFGHYGFPESHSASFALLAYATGWLKVHRPALFAACLINSQPMGFYSNATIVHDARVHGVECRPPDLRFSAWDCTLEAARAGAAHPWALRVGLRCIENLGAESRKRLEAARAEGPFRTIRDVIARSGLDRRALASLAQAGAFDGFLDDEHQGVALGDPTAEVSEHRRAALWRVLREARIPTTGLARFGAEERDAVAFDALAPHERIVHDYVFTGLSTHGHPMEVLRPQLRERQVLSAADAARARDGAWIKVAGMVIVRQRPATAKGFTFLSLEDETGVTNVIVAPQLFDKHRKVLTSQAFLEIHGVAQVSGPTVQVRARDLYALGPAEAPARSRDFH